MYNTNLIINLFYNITNKRKLFKKKIFSKFINNKECYPNIFNYLDSIYYDSNSYIETLYRLVNNIDNKPICPICGNKIQLSINSHIYFPKTCSDKCSKILTSQNTKINCLKKYGVDNTSKLEKTKEKYKQTCLRKYGIDYYVKTEIFKEKSKQTCLKNYGIDNILKNKNIHNKGIIASQTQKAKNKRNNTIKEKYCVNNISQNKDIKKKKEQTFLKHYGVKNTFGINYIKEKCNSIESRQKMYETKKKNNSFNTSKLEDKSYVLLKEKYPDIQKQYRSELYPFNCDFYIPSLDLYIECNYHWTHGYHPYDLNNTEDKNKIELWKSKQTKYYNNAIYTWTDLDIRKRNIAKENNLNYIEFWNIEELKEWLKNLESN